MAQKGDSKKRDTIKSGDSKRADEIDTLSPVDMGFDFVKTGETPLKALNHGQRETSS